MDLNPQSLNAAERVASIIALLMQHKKMTAPQMARHFGVSDRTIYRHMDVIVGAGLPVLGIAGDGYQWKPPPGAPT